MPGYTEDDKIAYQIPPDDIWIPVAAEVRQKLGPYVYRHRPGIGQERMAYYQPTNPRTRNQQAWRSVFADGVTTWKALPEPNKATWRKLAVGKHMTGYDLFMQDHLLTHTPTTYPWAVDISLISSTDYILSYIPFTIGTSWIAGPHYVKGPPPP